MLGVLAELFVVTVASAPFSSIGGAVELAASALIEAVVTSFVTIFQTLSTSTCGARRAPEPRPPSTVAGRRGLASRTAPPGGACATLPGWPHPTPP